MLETVSERENAEKERGRVTSVREGMENKDNTEVKEILLDYRHQILCHCVHMEKRLYITAFYTNKAK